MIKKCFAKRPFIAESVLPGFAYQKRLMHRSVSRCEHRASARTHGGDSADVHSHPLSTHEAVGQFLLRGENEEAEPVSREVPCQSASRTSPIVIETRVFRHSGPLLVALYPHRSHVWHETSAFNFPSETIGRSGGAYRPGASASTSTPSGSCCNRSGFCTSSATLPLLPLSCIDRSNPKPNPEAGGRRSEYRRRLECKRCVARRIGTPSHFG